ncbi:MAG: Hsp70 family protein [Micavibrio sp.]|nr:Hsp70 family protein [Micavibrio sp.]
MTICGIDFGTSNSALAVVADGNVQLVRVDEDSQTMPSAIFYHEDGTAVYGRGAIASFTSGDSGRFMRSFKRTLGTELLEYGAIINGKLKKYDQIIAGFIRHLKLRAESSLGIDLDNVVMGRPVHFVDNNTEADRCAQNQLEKIARLVGFKHIEFQFEPIAAAFAHEQKVIGEKITLVVDIGGGTSDFTIIRLSEASVHKLDRKEDILSCVGGRVGGNDFDRDFCLRSFMPILGYGTTYGTKGMEVPISPFFDMSEWSKINSLYVPKVLKNLREIYIDSHSQKTFGRFVRAVEERAGHKVLSTVESAKIDLTDKYEIQEKLEFLEDGLEIILTRDGFEQTIMHHIETIGKWIDNCLREASVAEEHIQLVILTGGTTEIPLLQKIVKDRFPHADISGSDKLSSVGLGLGYDGARRFRSSLNSIVSI